MRRMRSHVPNHRTSPNAQRSPARQQEAIAGAQAASQARVAGLSYRKPAGGFSLPAKTLAIEHASHDATSDRKQQKAGESLAAGGRPLGVAGGRCHQ